MNENEILLIEDDPDIIQSLSSLCENELGMSIIGQRNGAQGLAAALARPFSLVIIDVNLPSKNGFDICRALRKERAEQLILLLTGRREEVDKVLGLEIGADDYVTKPFSARELVARIRALLRRGSITSRESNIATTIEVGDLKIDTVGRRVWKGQALLQLTLIEFEILQLLAGNPGRLFDRRELINIVLGYTSGVHNDVLSVHLSRLRAKIDHDGSAYSYIKTVRGVGYRFAAPDELQAAA